MKLIDTIKKKYRIPWIYRYKGFHVFYMFLIISWYLDRIDPLDLLVPLLLIITYQK